jgi:hypothetical protein
VHAVCPMDTITVIITTSMFLTLVAAVPVAQALVEPAVPVRLTLVEPTVPVRLTLVEPTVPVIKIKNS